MKHNIVMTCEAKTPDALLLKRQIRKCILAALDEEAWTFRARLTSF